MKKKRIGYLLFSVVLAEALGFLSGHLSGDIGAKYAELTKPPLAPPGWLFPVMWIIMYTLMGIAAYRIFASDISDRRRNNALTFYALQLLVNFMWSIIFFGFGFYGAGLAVIILLDVLVIVTIACFSYIDKPAAWLMLPYLVWLLFATYLTVGIYVLN